MIATAIDRAAVDRARTGDLAAFELIVRARMDAVYRISLAILGDEADARDASQETFLAAWRQLGRLRDPERLDPWLQRIAVNTARMTLRSRSRRRVREIPREELITVTPTAEPRPDGEVLAGALQRLSADHRAVLALHYLEGRGVAEVSGILGVSEGTVKSRLFHARRALDAAIAAEERA